MELNQLSVVILAAGEGKRMRSALPKVRHQLAGQTLLGRVFNTSQELAPDQTYIVYGYRGDEVKASHADLNATWVEQKEQLGTGHAVSQVMPNISDESLVLILFGDVPLITTQTLKALIAATPPTGVGLLVTEVDDPTGLGRIVRNQSGDVLAIVEHKDATEEQLKIKEVFTGIMAAPAEKLRQWLKSLTNENAQGEYYLTDVPSMAIAEGFLVTRVLAPCYQEVQGVNDLCQLARLERHYQTTLARELMLSGVSICDPNRFDVRGSIECGTDVSIDINVLIEGNVKIGDHCSIGANCVLRNVSIGNGVTIKENSILEDSIIDDNCIVGPFARLRPGAHLHSNAHIGNFVEVKKSTVGQGSKVNHLTYIGDATIGKNVNVGAGTITCNYDGVNKFQTIIEDDAFIGSGTELVAPVKIKRGTTIGAGSTITEDTQADTLTLARARQATIENWQRPIKKES